ncbi:MAG: RNA methyltransferase [Psychrilyobacter sp.]|uniref:TrmH family RNA methyltransferase n=1 Tax=Psychrilyobacter sp. TaxID=2586924 RepID=UPI003C778D38
MEFINSKENKLFKTIKKLKLKKYREREKLFLAEGHKFLDFSIPPKYIILRDGVEEKFPKIDDFNCKKYIYSDTLFNDISTQENSQGVVLIYDFLYNSMDDLGENIVVLDRIQDPGNLGTIIRLVDAVGIKDMLLTTGSVDIYNEKSVRSSMGSLFNLNINYLSEENLIEFLKLNNYNILSSGLTNESVNYNKIKLKGKNAVVFGNEGQGVSKEILKASNEIVKIPIYGSAESLNVGVATGIILYKIKEILEEYEV